MRHYVQFTTRCGCSQVQEWYSAERPYGIIKVPLTDHVVAVWEPTDLTRPSRVEYKGLPIREFEEKHHTVLPNGDIIWTFHERNNG